MRSCWQRAVARGPGGDAADARHGGRAALRLEELTRMGSDVQDTLITVLSEKMLPIPELNNAVDARARLQHDRHRQQPRQGRQRAVLGLEAALQRGRAAAARRPREEARSSSSAWARSARGSSCRCRRPSSKEIARSSRSSASCATADAQRQVEAQDRRRGSLSTAEAIAVDDRRLGRGRPLRRRT